MGDWIDSPVHETIARLPEVSQAERDAILAGPKDAATHRAHFDRLPGLRRIEVGGAAPRAPAVAGAARIACWNVERLRHLDAIEATLRGAAVDVALLSEVDRGMARSGNGDPIVELSHRLGHTYVYAIEYLELDLGDLDEKRIHAGEINRVGFHGAAITAGVQLERPFLLRVEARGEWFDGSRHEPRVGGTIAVGAVVNVADVPVVAASVHLESHCTPAVRCEDAAQMLKLLDSIAPGAPTILGGDFNTSTASRPERDARDVWRARLAAEPDRLTRPEGYEPLFELLAANGYDWLACNVAERPTTRHTDRDRPRYKLDWFFTRGLVASEPEIIPAVRPDGGPSSDHECLVVKIKPQR
jgi:endonuclease/exonuclease/phosphatase family metal-dependent hydrolase